MSDTVEECVLNLVAAIAQRERGLIMTEIRRSLGGDGGELKAAAPPRARAARTARAPKRAARAKGAKRSPEELEKLELALHSYILKNQGERIEPIAQGMGVATRELNLPMKKLIAARAVTARGHKRATTYTAR